MVDGDLYIREREDRRRRRHDRVGMSKRLGGDMLGRDRGKRGRTRDDIILAP